jgi:glycosyltransferase involved in cell wall biosynthesis
MKEVPSQWIVCQIGAREHYAIARALERQGALRALVTDFWIEPGSVLGRLPGGRRLGDRYHGELRSATVVAPNLRMLGFELANRMRSGGGWPTILKRNRLFQRLALRELAAVAKSGEAPITVFSYSYAARELFRYAKERGWTTVLGQIDPGPEEERIVMAEHARFGGIGSSWQPVPGSYWESWKEEVALADRVIVNSRWSRDCLVKEGVDEGKLEVVPLVFSAGTTAGDEREGGLGEVGERPLRLLFLGQVNLRKGVARLLEAMRLLRDEAVELTLAGPSEVDPAAWADLPMVRWVGSVPRSMVAGYYRAADLFILPTLSDGYALTQLEAMAHGLPVLASRYCGEAVRAGENGFVIEEVSAEGIAAAIREARARLPLRGVRAPGFTLDDLGCELRRCGRERGADSEAGVDSACLGK